MKCPRDKCEYWKTKKEECGKRKYAMNSYLGVEYLAGYFCNLDEGLKNEYSEKTELIYKVGDVVYYYDANGSYETINDAVIECHVLSYDYDEVRHGYYYMLSSTSPTFEAKFSIFSTRLFADRKSCESANKEDFNDLKKSEKAWKKERIKELKKNIARLNIEGGE